MNSAHLYGSPWSRSRLAVLSAAVLVGASAPSHATGFYGPDDYLGSGGESVIKAPEFYWELEVKRLARDFRPAEAPPVPPTVFPPRPPSGNSYSLDEAMDRPRSLTATADSNDFEAAIKEGRIKPPDAVQAQDQHDGARTALDKGLPLEGEFASEFADYHRGAAAFRKGPEGFAEARQAWAKLLQRPTAERHYRTVWATFMLGKLALKEGSAEAPKWFQETRARAREGFADSLAMAADSYGWEGRSEWKQKHPEKAAPLFLTQLALGDESAVESLKALIPDRPEVGEMLNYSPVGSEAWTEEQRAAYQQQMPAQLKALARDPLLRRLETVHILATETTMRWTDPSQPAREEESRVARWLRAVKEAGVKQTPDAEYLGWAAYHAGDYKGAAAWLEQAKGDSAAAAWLRAKLLRRTGKLAEAAQSMLVAWKKVDHLTDYTGWHPAPPEPQPPADPADATAPATAPEEEPGEELYEPHSLEGWGFRDHAGGDLGGLLLARGDFVQALDAFLKAGLWSDAAFVAERVLTADELKAYVDREVPRQAKEKEEKKPDEAAARRKSLSYLLGRRLVREDRYAEAAAYLEPPYDKLLTRYTQALSDGANAKLPKPQRAEAWFRAAWIARYDGMELMGTEVAPDGFASSGNFSSSNLAIERRTGKVMEGAEDEEKKVVKPVALVATKEEVTRLKKHQIHPEIRFHYRVVAGALAMKAAALLPDQTPELADVINTAGEWVKDRDEKTADGYYEELLHRAGKTEIGKAARVKKYFVDESGPWSTREAEASEQWTKENRPQEQDAAE